MIQLDLSVTDRSAFGFIADQLIDQAGVYARRETKGKEPGQEVLIGENLNVYMDYKAMKVWILKKPRIDG